MSMLSCYDYCACLYFRCTEEFLSPKRPFFGRADFYPSPPQLYCLPPYIEPLASVLARQPPSPKNQRSPATENNSTMPFVDDFAIEASTDSSDSECDEPRGIDLSSDSEL